VEARRLIWIAVGLVLLAVHCLLVPLSRAFDYGAPLSELPIIEFVALEIMAGGAYLILLWLIPRTRPESALLTLVIAVGLAIRAVTMASTPVLEDDFHRYLWDGAVVAGGNDPYRYSPAEVLSVDGSERSTPELSELSALAQASRPVAQRINYPRLTTVYPPLAQGAFALGAVVEPFSLTAWRVILLLCEGATLVLLYLVLLRLNRSPLWLAIYWWNPLIVKELVNSAHMDALLLPVLTGVLLLMLLGRRVLACGGLALAAGFKLWPVLLLPIALRPLAARPEKLLAALAVFLVTFAGTAWWIYAQARGESGLSAYLSSWRMNDAFFQGFHWVVSGALTGLQLEWINGGGVARALVVASILWLALWLNRHVAGDADELCRRFMILTAMVFLLSPAQFPWYYTWLLPFLVVAPSPALLLLTVMLPLYYLRFFLDFRGESHLFDHGIVWLEYLPVWLLLAREWWLRVPRVPPPRLEIGQA
jgi:alpha-1,6-mannosyltransferase